MDTKKGFIVHFIDHKLSVLSSITFFSVLFSSLLKYNGIYDQRSQLVGTNSISRERSDQ